MRQFKLKGNVTFKIDKGILELGGTRVSLVPSETAFYLLRKELERFAGDDYHDVIFNIGRESALTFAKRLLKENALKEDEESFKGLIELHSSAGFGDFRIERLNFETLDIVITSSNALEASAALQNNERTEDTICDFNRGSLLGYLEGLREGEFICVETECIAKGDDVCRFIIREKPLGLRVIGKRFKLENDDGGL